MAQQKKHVTSWKRSVQPRKQRSYTRRAPLHIKQSLMHVHLIKALREKHGKRAIQVRKGDKVKVTRGSYKGKEGSVERVALKAGKVYIQGVEKTKKDNSRIMIGFTPSNLMITVLNMKDTKRKAVLEGKKPKVEKTEAKKESPSQ